MKRRLPGIALWPYAGVTLIVLARCLPFLIHGRELDDADEAVFGILAKWMAADGRIPFFMYGNPHQLSLPRLPLSSWMAAPLFLIWGSSVALLRLPLLVLNLLVANGLVFLFKRQAKLSSAVAFLCSLWFALPSAHASWAMMNAAETVPETFFFVLLLWCLRSVPFIGGAATIIGMSARPFVIYGFIALALLEWRSGTWKDLLIRGSRWIAGMAAGYAGLWITAHHQATYWGLSNVSIHKRFRFMLEDLRGFFAEIVPQTLGLQVQRFNSPFSLISMSTHFNWLGLLLCPVLAYLSLRMLSSVPALLRQLKNGELRDSRFQFPLYLVAVGALTFVSYVVAAPPSDDIRYTYLILLGLAGTYALVDLLQAQPRYRALAGILLGGCLLNNLYSNARLARDVAQLERAHPTANLIRYLRENGIRAALGDFWSSYNITFQSDEAVLVVPGLSAHEFIPRYTALYLATPADSRAEIRLSPCNGGVKVEDWYVCRPR